MFELRLRMRAQSPEVLAEKLQRKSSTIIGEASATIWDLHPRLGQLGARDIAGVLLAAGTEGETVNN